LIELALPYIVGYNASVKLTLVQSPLFVSLWRYFDFDDDDLRALERQVMEHPLAGKVIRNTNGVRKIRFSPPSRRSGKSGAYQSVIYLPAIEAVYFLLIFQKSEQPNLTPAQEKACREFARGIKRKMT